MPSLPTRLTVAALGLAVAGGGAASATGVSFDVHAADRSQTAPNLAKVGPTTWRGAATERKLGNGTLTLVGSVRFHAGATTHSRLRFVFKSAKGTVRGCVRNTVVLRPGSRYVWDGPGQIQTTTRALRPYRGLKVRIGGVTKTSDLKRARIDLSSRAPGGAC